MLSVTDPCRIDFFELSLCALCAAARRQPVKKFTGKPGTSTCIDKTQPESG